MLTLINTPPYKMGSLWFEIPQNLQAAMIPFLSCQINDNVTNKEDRKTYRHALTKASMKEKYGPTLHAKLDKNLGYVAIYTSYGVWRVGDREIKVAHANAIKAGILRDIESYADLFAQTA